MKARPTNSFFGTGPMIRESAESPRLSPIMKYSPFGIGTRPEVGRVVTLRAATARELLAVDVDLAVLGRRWSRRAGR